MKNLIKFLIIFFSLPTVVLSQPCSGITGTGTTRTKATVVCYDTVKTASHINNLTVAGTASIANLIVNGNQAVEADATNFVTGPTVPYFKNKDYVGSLFKWDFTNGTTGWTSSGSGTTWALNGNYLQASVGGGASDYTNQYKYTYQFVNAGQQPELLNFIPTVNASNAGEGIAVGVKTNDGILDFLAKLDLSNTGTRGQLLIYKVVSGTPTLLATSATNLSYTTNADNLSLKINIRVDGYIDAKVLNNTTSTSVYVSTTSIQALGANRVAKMCIWHFGGTIKIPTINFKNTSPKAKKAILIGDSVTNGYSSSLINAAKGDVYLEAGSGGTSGDIVNCLDGIINSGAQIAIIMIGMNDAIQSVSSSTYIANLRKIVQGVQESGMRPVICYVTPTTNSTYNTFIQSYNTAILSEYNGIYTIIDNYSILSVGNNLTGALQPGYDSGDGIHPNSTGYALIVTQIQTNTTSILLSRPALTNTNNTFTASQTMQGDVNFNSATRQIGTTDANTIQIKTNNQARTSWDSDGLQSSTQTALSTGTTPFVQYTQGNNTGGATPGFLWTAGSHTSQTTATEITDVNWNLSGVLRSLDGTIANMRTFRIQGRTYTPQTSTLTITEATTLDVTQPSPGSGTTFTNRWSIKSTGSILCLGDISFTGAARAIGTTDANQFAIRAGGSSRTVWTSAGLQTHTHTAASSGTTPMLTYTQAVNTGGSAGLSSWTSAACTGQTSGTEISEHLWGMNATKTWSTSVPTTQRFARFRAPTMSCASVSTSTTAATLSIEGAPSATGSASITNPFAFWVESGNSALNGNVAINQSTNANSTLQVAGSVSFPYTSKTNTYSIAANDYMIDCTSGTFTVTLPTAVGITGRVYVIKNSGVGTITVATTSSQTIDGSTTATISVQYNSISVQSNGSNWIIF